MSLADKVKTGTYNFVSLIAKMILLESSLSVSFADKTQYFSHLGFNFTLQFINCLSSDLQKLLKYFNDTAIVAFFRIPLALFGADWATVFPNKLALFFYTGMAKSKSSTSYIVVPSIFVIPLVNGAQFVNDTCVAGTAVTKISPFTKM